MGQMCMTNADTTQDNFILPAPLVGGLPIFQDWLDRNNLIEGRLHSSYTYKQNRTWRVKRPEIFSCKCISTTPIGALIYIWPWAAIPPVPPLFQCDGGQTKLINFTIYMQGKYIIMVPLGRDNEKVQYTSQSACCQVI